MSTPPDSKDIAEAKSGDTPAIPEPQDMEDEEKLQAMLLQAQRVEDIAKLAGSIAHDLNNLLAPIRMAAELLERYCKDPDLDRYVEIIQTSTSRARSVIQEILAFSRESDSAECQVMDVNVLLQELENMVKQTFPEKITLKFEYQDEAPHVEMDPHQLHRSILNLLVNAKDAVNEDGEIGVRVSTHDLEFRVCAGDRCAVPGCYTCISVSDNGCGIPEDIRHQIFDPFFTTKPKEKGTGLGLASVYGIVARAGGFIDLETVVGKGTIFHVFLPEARSGKR